MAFAMPKVDYSKIGVLILLLLDLGIAYPLYLKTTEGISELTKIDESTLAGSVIHLKQQGLEEEDTVQIKTGFPPSQLLTWDPFEAPKTEAKQGDTSEEETESEVVLVLPIPTDNLRILGIISLNGRYMALMSTSEENSAEVRQGQIIQGTENIRASKITAQGILLTQPGAENTFLPLTQPGLSAQPWFSGGDTSAIRGRIEYKGTRRR